MPANSNISIKTNNSKKNFRRRVTRILIAAVCLTIAFVLIGKVLCKIVLHQIADITNTTISTDSVDFNVNGSVLIKGLVIRPKQQKKYNDTILKAETVYARFGIDSLLLLHPQLKRLNIKDFVFDAQHNLDTDQWNISTFSIKPPKGAGGKMPVIRLKRGTLRYSKVSNGEVKTIAAVHIDAEFVSVPNTRNSYSFIIATDKQAGSGKSILTGIWDPGIITLSGGISSADIPAFEKAWTVNAMDAKLNYDRKKDYSFELKIKDLSGRHTPLINILPADKEVFSSKQGAFTALKGFFYRFRPSGEIAISIEAKGNLERLTKSTLTGELYCKDISICDRRFPYIIQHLTGLIDLTEKSAVLNNLYGRHGDTELTLNGWTKGFGPDRQYLMSIKSGNMALDSDLYEALNTRQKKSWLLVSPNGLASIDYNLSKEPGSEKKVTLMVDLLGAEAVYSYFPYPLKNLSGKMLFTDDSITFSGVNSRIEDSTITLNGKLTNCSTEQPICDISVNARDIPLDSTLASSLSDKKKGFYNQLNMTGFADADIKIFTPEQNSVSASFIADVSIKKAALKADDFPLLISEISARTIITPDLIQIEKFTGRHNQTMVSLTGTIWPDEAALKPRYCLLLNTEHTELNDEFISLLPPTLKKIVSELQPEGKVNLSVNLNNADSSNCSDYMITVECTGNSIKFEMFAYPVKDVTGKLMIKKNMLVMEDITATVADNTMLTSAISTVKINGHIMLAENALSSDRFGFSRGNIFFTADNLKIKGKSLTGFKADTYYDPNRQSWITKSLVADFYDGSLAGKFELKLSADNVLEYQVEAGFNNADLKQFLSDTNPAEPSRNDLTSGKMGGVLSIAGRTGESLTSIGRCRLQINDMQVGKLSPLAKLLHVLKLTEPKDFAFEHMLVNAYIKHDKLIIEQLDLSGKAIAFNGSGSLNLQNRNVNLVLFARGARLSTAEPSILQSLTESLGHAVVRMDVTGNVNDPTVTTTPLPVLKEAAQIIGTPRRKK